MLIRPWLKAAHAYVSDPFRDVPADPVLHADIRSRQKARKTYVIFFTPRSGSTRLASILSSTGLLGMPSEVFNPFHIVPVATACAARTLDAYLDALPRVKCAGGVFGFKITCMQVLMMFRREARFFETFRGAAFFWLIREDIVAQAVSSSRMVQTGVPRALGSARRARASEASFQYQAGDIRRRIRRLRWMERRSERFFRRFGISPVRLSYERLLCLDESQTAGVFADALGVKLPADVQAASQYLKVGTGKAEEFAERFRREHPAFVARIEADRQPLLEALDEMPPGNLQDRSSPPDRPQAAHRAARGRGT
ncbi:MAG: Stf0 family sulfotransferase [Rhodobacter sp.]|nr:Stf0 family sulfotransferase [Rhodobacter sp.]